MKITQTIGILLMTAAFGLAACGGDDDDSSGIDRSKKVTALTTDERKTLCEWGVEAQGGAGKMTKCGDITITVKPAADCIAQAMTFPASCALTVAQVEDCSKATGENACTSLTAPACLAFLDCFAGD